MGQRQNGQPQKDHTTYPMNQMNGNALQNGSSRHNSQRRGRDQSQGSPRPYRKRGQGGSQPRHGNLGLVTQFGHEDQG